MGKLDEVVTYRDFSRVKQVHISGPYLPLCFAMHRAAGCDFPSTLMVVAMSVVMGVEVVGVEVVMGLVEYRYKKDNDMHSQVHRPKLET